MTSRDFCFWMMGSLELVDPEDGLNEKQTQILKNHLNMVFEHIVNKDGTLKDEAGISSIVQPKESGAISEEGIHPFLKKDSLKDRPTAWYDTSAKLNC